MGKEYTAEELYAFLANVAHEVEDKDFSKYKKKLLNCYVNNSVKAIDSDTVSFKNRFVVMLAVLAYMTETEKHSTGKDTQVSFAEIKQDILSYLTKKEISKIRALILDLHTSTYTDSKEWSPYPEPWAREIVEELDAVLPESAHPQVQEALSLARTHLLSLLVQELKDIFFSTAQPFGKQGNLFVVNLVYLQTYFEKKLPNTNIIAEFITEVQSNFQKGEVPEKTEIIRKLQLKK
ncbi:hypothetical protein NECID01_1929 [Nematocida sp. AWRm77]|nr:hypothetical protein NECID01_1929 [Nematocida sp. AWRm77]